MSPAARTPGVPVLYDKPVRELLADCVRELTAPFGRDDVIRWFGDRYPAVKASTVSTHLAGLTEGPRPHANLAQYPPLVRRVDHGLYAPTTHALGRGAPPAPRQRDRTPRDPATPADLLLLGCVKSKHNRPAPARDLYTSPLFMHRRRYAEAVGRPW